MTNYTGKDNYGRPKSDYLAKLAEMTDDELGRECYSMIYQSARCNNKPRADWHWMADACYDEAAKRGEGAPLYSEAFDRCYAEHAA